MNAFNIDQFLPSKYSFVPVASICSFQGKKNQRKCNSLVKTDIWHNTHATMTTKINTNVNYSYNGALSFDIVAKCIIMML